MAPETQTSPSIWSRIWSRITTGFLAIVWGCTWFVDAWMTSLVYHAMICDVRGIADPAGSVPPTPNMGEWDPDPVRPARCIWSRSMALMSAFGWLQAVNHRRDTNLPAMATMLGMFTMPFFTPRWALTDEAPVVVILFFVWHQIVFWASSRPDMPTSNVLYDTVIGIGGAAVDGLRGRLWNR